MKCNDGFQCDTKQFGFAGLYGAQGLLGCQLTGSTKTLCLSKCWNFRNFILDDWCNLA